MGGTNQRLAWHCNISTLNFDFELGGRGSHPYHARLAARAQKDSNYESEDVIYNV